MDTTALEPATKPAITEKPIDKNIGGKNILLLLFNELPSYG